MMTIRVDDLLAYVREKREHCTLVRGLEFQARVVEEGLTVTPASTAKSRHIPHDELDEVCEQFNRTGSFSPKDYQDVTFNGSYILSIVSAVEHGRVTGDS